MYVTLNERRSFSTAELLIRRKARDPSPEPSISHAMRGAFDLTLHTDGSVEARRDVTATDCTKAIFLKLRGMNAVCPRRAESQKKKMFLKSFRDKKMCRSQNRLSIVLSCGYWLKKDRHFYLAVGGGNNAG